MQSVLAGLVRHALTAAGGSLVTQGLITSGDIEIVAGAVIAIGGVIWSAFAKRKAK